MSPRSSLIARFPRFVIALTTLALVASLPAAAGTPVACVVPDNGFHTASLPPLPCSYVALQPLQVVAGLPPGSTVELEATIDSFFDITYMAGGGFGSGGHVQQFQAALRADLSGTGSLAGYFRPAFFDVFCEVHEGPRGGPGPDIQSFNTAMVTMFAQLPPGDPDFDLLRITGGFGYGLPSPGHTTLSSVATGWSVDSFFDITYRIDFVGAPGGPFAGRSGSTTLSAIFRCGTTDAVTTESGTWGGVKALYR